MYRLFYTMLLFTAVALSVHLASAQEQPAKTGVHFDHELSWAEIQARAKAEHKYIFMDCFTTWCGPCRFMSTTIFPQPAMGDYFNDKFVSIAVQLDTTSKDNEYVRSWYADAHTLMYQYRVEAFPTYLVFTPEGQVIHRMVGSSATAGEFLAKVRNSFDSSKQYYTQMREYEAGRRDSGFLRRLTLMSADGYDINNVRKFGSAYLHTQSDVLQPPILDMVLLCTLKSKDDYFDFLVHHIADVDKIKGAGTAEARIREIVLSEGSGNKNGEPKWDSLQRAIAMKVPDTMAAEVTARIKLNFYLGRADWAKFEPAMVAYMKTYGARMSDNDLNTVAWRVFERCPDMSCVTAVLDWSKQLKEGNEPGYIDTYANILYKLGKKDDAIALEEKAMNLAPSDARADYQSTIDKMKKGEKTWN